MAAFLRRVAARVRRGLATSRRTRPSGPGSVVNVLNDELIVCNFCATVFKRSGENHSEFLACPYCDAIARERVMYHCLLSEQGGQSGTHRPFIAGNTGFRNSVLLECSPRPNPKRLHIYQQVFGRYLASDCDLASHRAAVKMDLTREDDIARHLDAFDIILCSHVLEHIRDYPTALRNLWRMLKPGGYAVLQVPLLEDAYTEVTWDEFHGDHTRVFHRFGFDLLHTLEHIFTTATPVVGLLDFSITSPEIARHKYALLQRTPERCHVIGVEALNTHGLGIPDLCDAFIVRK
jgi:SAM-dependent methyltransferase